MIRTLVTAAAVSGLMMSTALAQAPSTGAQSPAAKSGMQSSQSGSANAQAITQQGPNQWLASKFMGTDVIGTDDNKIGDVSDVLFDKQGKVEALVVGVGGFLGIGQKDIALPLSSFDVIAAKSGSNNTSSDQLRLSMTKDQLTQLAEFKSKDDQSSTTTGSAPNATGTGSSTGTGTGTGMGAGGGSNTTTPSSR
ncbi:hypothetical protein A33M_0315 [Rhodovulum sp. PH10]|uniref:PRC-barrel domain-containing protein n=1 Tax=Rhodovulum sp. PH10 TaxID=1187851 RepID=UPI00027C216B|nr:PRC-barrel domain-containing protein [Rhodovulum sp. PH10]EJW13156.1 hypothetical protein A33M_0315 [Rhodovulum sp. PH10]